MERDRFMSPQEAKEFGLIDKILEQPPKLEDSRDTWSSSSQNASSGQDLCN